MKKIILISTIIIMSYSSSLFAAVTLRYYNKDSRNHTFNVRICGVTKTVTFGSSRTASVTIQGCSEAEIETKCGKIKVKDGANIEIKDGCIKIK